MSTTRYTNFWKAVSRLTWSQMECYCVNLAVILWHTSTPSIPKISITISQNLFSTIKQDQVHNYNLYNLQNNNTLLYFKFYTLLFPFLTLQDQNSLSDLAPIWWISRHLLHQTSLLPLLPTRRLSLHVQLILLAHFNGYYYTISLV